MALAVVSHPRAGTRGVSLARLMDIAAVLKLQKILAQMTPRARATLASDLYPIIARRLPPALVTDAVEAVGRLLKGPLEHPKGFSSTPRGGGRPRVKG